MEPGLGGGPGQVEEGVTSSIHTSRFWGHFLALPHWAETHWGAPCHPQYPLPLPTLSGGTTGGPELQSRGSRGCGPPTDGSESGPHFKMSRMTEA